MRATKKSTENLAHSYSSLWKLPITMLRFLQYMGLMEDQIWHILVLQKNFKWKTN